MPLPPPPPPPPHYNIILSCYLSIDSKRLAACSFCALLSHCGPDYSAELYHQSGSVGEPYSRASIKQGKPRRYSRSKCTSDLHSDPSSSQLPSPPSLYPGTALSTLTSYPNPPAYSLLLPSSRPESHLIPLLIPVPLVLSSLYTTMKSN